MSFPLLSIILGSLISEDLACIAAGVGIAQGMLTWYEGMGAAAFGIFLGDLMLYWAGRLFDIRSRVAPQRLHDAQVWLQSHDLLAVLLSRFIPGLRLPTYLAAGLLRVPALRFSAVLLLAVLLWTPLLVGATVLGLRHLPLWLLALPLLFWLLFPYLRPRLTQAWRKWSQWEFWPAWAAYLPLLPYLLFLALKHRGLTVFTAANPGIPSGGLTGESKADILTQLSQHPTAVPFFRVAEPGAPASLWPADYPLVAKPDVGERGEAVRILRSPAQLSAYLERATQRSILQAYVDGLEFGIFYARHPAEPRGRILSITGKRFPQVVGDGQRSIRALLRADARARILETAYEDACPRPLDNVPAPGEEVPLVEIGSHCRGTIFYDARSLHTPQLEQAIEDIARCHSGFYFGRFDIRVPSVAALQAGQGIRVLELNGVGGEAAHIYDPQVSLVAAYRTLCEQWRLAFAIGAANQRLGHRRLGTLPLWRTFRERRRLSSPRRAPVAQPEPDGKQRIPRIVRHVF